MSHIVVLGLNPTLQKTLILANSAVQGGVNRLQDSLLSIGGKGANTARMIAQLGGSVSHITLSGGASGKVFEQLLGTEPFASTVIPTASDVRFCYTHVLDNPFSATEFVEPGGAITPQEVKDTTLAIDKALYAAKAHMGTPSDNCVNSKALATPTWLVIAGSAAPGFGETYYADIAKKASNAGVGVVVDIHGPTLLQVLPFTQVVKINMYEFALSCMQEMPHNQIITNDWYTRIEAKASALAHRYDTSFVLTNGSGHTLVVDTCNSLRITPTPVKQPKNPIGCGDAVTAGVVHTLAQGGTLFDGATLGMECARKNVLLRKTGTIL